MNMRDIKSELEDKGKFEVFLNILSEEGINNLFDHNKLHSGHLDDDSLNMLVQYDEYKGTIMSEYVDPGLKKIHKNFNKSFTLLFEFIGEHFSPVGKPVKKYILNSKTKRIKLRKLSRNFGKEYKSFVKKASKYLSTSIKISTSAIQSTKKKNQIQVPKLPPGTRWENITIRFLNDYDIRVDVKKIKFLIDYEKMGFADERIKKTEEKVKTKNCWGFLQLLSTKNGEFDLNTLIGEEKNQRIKQKQILTKILKEFFPTINDDPFYEYDETKGIYKIKIKLIPDKTFREDFRDKDIKEETKNKLGIEEGYKEEISN